MSAFLTTLEKKLVTFSNLLYYSMDEHTKWIALGYFSRYDILPRLQLSSYKQILDSPKPTNSGELTIPSITRYLSMQS